MYKFFTVIFFSFFVESAMAAHQGALEGGRCHEYLMRELAQICARIPTVTYQDIEGASGNRVAPNSVYSLGLSLKNQKGRWDAFTKVCTDETNQKLVLSVAFQYLQNKTDFGMFNENVSDFFRFLTEYLKRSRPNIFWEPPQRTVITLYYLCSYSNSLYGSISSTADIEKLVVALQSLPIRDIPRLFSQRDLICDLKSLSKQISVFLKGTIPATRTDRNTLSLEDMQNYLSTVGRLNQVLGKFFDITPILQLCYSPTLNSYQREALVNSIVALPEMVLENIPSFALNSRVSEISNWSQTHERALTPQDIRDAFLALAEDHRPRTFVEGERQGRASARWSQITHDAWVHEHRHAWAHERPPISIAMEAHNYAGEEVTVSQGASAAACAAGGSAQVRLIDAIFRQVEGRLGTRAVVPFSEVRTALGRFSSAPAFQSVLENPADQRLMAIIYTFLKAFYPDKVDLWKAQFIRESEEAYGGRHDSTSCVKGIRERIITGLRGIDPELDRTFAQVEGRHLMRARATGANPRENPQALARQLLELGIRPTTPVAKAAARFKSDFEDKLKTYGLEVDAEFKGQADIFAELIEGELENAQSALSQALKSEFNKGNWKKAFKGVKKQNRAEKKQAMVERLSRMAETPEQRRARLAKAAEERHKKDQS